MRLGSSLPSAWCPTTELSGFSCRLQHEQEADARWEQELQKLTELHASRLSALEKKQAALAAQNRQLRARCRFS